LALWFPFTLICFLVGLCSVGLFISLGGNNRDLAGYFYVRGVWLFMPVGITAMILLFISLRYEPEERLLKWEAGLATLALCIVDCALIFAPGYVDGLKNRYFVRVHFVDERGDPVPGNAGKYGDDKIYHSDSLGFVTLEGTRKAPLEFSYRGFSLNPQLKLVSCSYVYQARPEPHLHARYIVNQDRHSVNQHRLIEDTSSEADYPMIGNPVDVKVVMETLR